MSARVGVVGYGRWGANIVRDLMELGADVVVAEPDVDARARARHAGVHDAVASAEELPECDGYVVATAARSHFAVCEHLLGRATPIFVEKPPCTDLAEVRKLAEADAGRLFVMHKWRYHPGIRALADLAASGRLGTVERLETTRQGPEALPPDVDALWHLGTHDLSIAIELLGAVAPVQHARAQRDPDGRIYRCDATMAFPGGPAHRMSVASGAPTRIRRVVLSGSDATAILTRPDARAIRVDGRGRVEELALASTAPLAEELRTFLAYLDGGEAPASDVATALAVAERLTELQRAAVDVT